MHNRFNLVVVIATVFVCTFLCCFQSIAEDSNEVEQLRSELEKFINAEDWSKAKSSAKKLRSKLRGAERKQVLQVLHRIEGEIAWKKLFTSNKKDKNKPRKQLQRVDGFLKKHGEVSELLPRADAERERILKRIYLTIEDFENQETIDPDLVQVGEPELVKQGSYSARFKAGREKQLSVIFVFEDTDWTKYSALVMWVYSKEKIGRITIDAVTSGGDYFEAWNNITWTGWKEVRIPLRGKGSRFSRIKKADWAMINQFRIWKDDGTPLDIVIDDIRLERIIK